MNKKLLPLTSIVLMMIAVIGLSTSFYKTTKNNDINATVAKPIFSVNGTDSINITDINVKNIDEDNAITVSNTKNGETSQVGIEYYISFVSNSNISLDDVEITAKRNGNSTTITNGKTQNFILNANSSQTDTWTFTVRYISNKDTSNGVISIKINSKQVQPSN